MYKNHNLIKTISFSFFILSSFDSHMAHSSIINIFNDNEDNIVLKIIPEPAFDEYTYCWKCIAGLNMGLKHNVSLNIATQAFRGINHFAVRGTTGGFLFNGECRNLSVFKNYEIHFLNDRVGTTCVSKEI